MRAAILALLLAGCSFIRDATYPDYVRPEFPDHSKAAPTHLCVTEKRVDSDGKPIADRWVCVDAGEWLAAPSQGAL